MNDAKRKLKGYKVKDVFYQKAKNRATREGGSLAKLLECVVVAYGHGMNIRAENNRSENNSGKKTKYITLDEIAAIYELNGY